MAKQTNKSKSPIRENIEMVKLTLPFVGEPTYKFQKGDPVICGHLQDAVIEDVLYDGKIYVVRYTEKPPRFSQEPEKTGYYVTTWTGCRPANPNTTDKIFSRKYSFGKLSFSNQTVESILFNIRNFGFDMNPPYQRDYVWSESDKERLIESIFMGADTGRFVIAEKHSTQHLKSQQPLFEVVDGKQRMKTLVDLYENRLPYQGVFFNDMQREDRYTIMNHIIPVAQIEMDEYDPAKLAELFVLLNRSGRTMNDSEIENAEKLIRQKGKSQNE